MSNNFISRETVFFRQMRSAAEAKNYTQEKSKDGAEYQLNKEGQPHNEFGPAVLLPNGEGLYFLDGIKHSEEDFKKIIEAKHKEEYHALREKGVITDTEDTLFTIKYNKLPNRLKNLNTGEHIINTGECKVASLMMTDEYNVGNKFKDAKYGDRVEFDNKDNAPVVQFGTVENGKELKEYMPTKEKLGFWKATKKALTAAAFLLTAGLSAAVIGNGYSAASEQLIFDNLQQNTTVQQKLKESGVSQTSVEAVKKLKEKIGKQQGVYEHHKDSEHHKNPITSTVQTNPVNNLLSAENGYATDASVISKHFNKFLEKNPNAANGDDLLDISSNTVSQKDANIMVVDFINYADNVVMPAAGNLKPLVQYDLSHEQLKQVSKDFGHVADVYNKMANNDFLSERIQNLVDNGSNHNSSLVGEKYAEHLRGIAQHCEKIKASLEKGDQVGVKVELKEFGKYLDETYKYLNTLNTPDAKNKNLEENGLHLQNTVSQAKSFFEELGKNVHVQSTSTEEILGM